MRCTSCKNKISKYARCCPYCNAEVNSNNDAVNEYMDKLEKKAVREKESRKVKEFHLGRKGMAAIACIMTALLISGYTYYRKSNVWEINEDTIFYAKDDKLIGKNLKTDKSFTVASSIEDVDSTGNVVDMNEIQNNTLRYDEETESLYYAGDIGTSYNSRYYTIYKKDCTNQKRKASTIVEDVYLSQWTEDGELYYTTTDKSQLYYYDDGKCQEYDISGVTKMQYNEELNVIIISAAPVAGSVSNLSEYENYEQEIYILDCNDNTITEICSSNWASLVMENLDHVYYLDYNVLYDYDMETGKSVAIASDVRDFVYVNSGEDQGLYYIQYTLEGHSLSEYFVDEYKEADEKVEKDQQLKERETEQECEQREERNVLRETVEQKKIYFYNTVLIHDTEKGEEISATDINTFDYDERSMDYMPAYTKLAKGSLSFTYEDVKHDVTLQRVEYSEFYEGKDYEECDGWTEYVYRNYEAESEDSEYCFDVCVMADYSNYYYIEDGQEKVATDEYYESLDDNEVIYGINNASLKEAKLSVGELNYYVDSVDFNLIRQKEDESEEVIAELINGYRVLDDGNILVRLNDSETGQENLVYIEGEKTITIDTDVTGIFGTNSWNYYSV